MAKMDSTWWLLILVVALFLLFQPQKGPDQKEVTTNFQEKEATTTTLNCYEELTKKGHTPEDAANLCEVRNKNIIKQSEAKQETDPLSKIKDLPKWVLWTTAIITIIVIVMSVFFKP